MLKEGLGNQFYVLKWFVHNNDNFHDSLEHFKIQMKHTYHKNPFLKDWSIYDNAVIEDKLTK